MSLGFVHTFVLLFSSSDDSGSICSSYIPGGSSELIYRDTNSDPEKEHSVPLRSPTLRGIERQDRQNGRSKRRSQPVRAEAVYLRGARVSDRDKASGEGESEIQVEDNEVFVTAQYE